MQYYSKIVLIIIIIIIIIILLLLLFFLLKCGRLCLLTCFDSELTPKHRMLNQ
jgi:hypothetical protein